MQGIRGACLSAEYRIFETREFKKSLKKLPAGDMKFIKKKLAEYIYPQIKEEPCYGQNIKKLQGYTPPTWRYRAGRMRVFYIIDFEEKTIYILTVEYRKDAYR